jgi:hypothetical protein
MADEKLHEREGLLEVQPSFLFVFLKQGLRTLDPSSSSSPGESAGITGVHHHIWPNLILRAYF